MIHRVEPEAVERPVRVKKELLEGLVLMVTLLPVEGVKVEAPRAESV